MTTNTGTSYIKNHTRSKSVVFNTVILLPTLLLCLTHITLTTEINKKKINNHITTINDSSWLDSAALELDLGVNQSSRHGIYNNHKSLFTQGVYLDCITVYSTERYGDAAWKAIGVATFKKPKSEKIFLADIEIYLNQVSDKFTYHYTKVKKIKLEQKKNTEFAGVNYKYSNCKTQ